LVKPTSASSCVFGADAVRGTDNRNDLTVTDTARFDVSKSWLSVALSTGAELLYNEHRFRKAHGLADMAWQVDSGCIGY